MTDVVVKRSVMIAGHRTSVSLEAPFWDALREIAMIKGASVASLIVEIDSHRSDSNLSSAIRLFVLAHYREATSTITGKRQV
ncbi:ribbon-helix-helix domain-containing protein [Pseudochelatococcus sp. G4_1912]|uniref:ribbon-helix-helix domain-containing protein n=1 Tax=Pseudochelatococcus sp. G4_1912 TaxID=3114288 RepID=UPI0039C5CEC3